MENFNPFSIFLIWLFAGAIVALGLKELHTMHGQRAGVSQVEVDSLVNKLKGNQKVIRPQSGERASYVPEEKVQETADGVSSKAKDIINKIFPGQKQ